MPQRPQIPALIEDALDIVRVSLGHRLLRGLRPGGLVRLLKPLAQGRRDLYMLQARHARERPDQLALADDLQSLSWGELEEATERLAAGLVGLGLHPRDRIGLVTLNRVEHLVALSAILRIGGIPAPMSPHTPVLALREKLAGAGLAACVIEPQLAAASGLKRTVVLDPLPGHEPSSLGLPYSAMAATPPLKGLRFPIRVGDAPDMVLFTSGTTGSSKGARIQMRQARLGTAFRYMAGFDVRQGDVLFTPCPLYHAAPMLLSGLTMATGGGVITSTELELELLPERWLRQGVTHAFMVPTLLDRLSRHPDLEKLRGGPLRALISGGAACRPELKQRLLDRLGDVVYDFYGATELGVVSIATPADLRQDLRTVGRPLRGVEVLLADDEGKPVPPGQPGELFVRSDMLSSYEGVAAGTDPLRAAGWSSAGDVAIQDSSGLLRIVDRKKDLIVTGGVNVFPAEVERVVEQHAGVRECAVTGVADATWGEAVAAFVVLEPGCGLDEAELRAFCKERMNAAMVPKSFTALEEIPRSAAGKVLRRELS
jgi:acyl-CoA synthetase (AMP-forming)/AMP-acid ligase II